MTAGAAILQPEEVLEAVRELPIAAPYTLACYSVSDERPGFTNNFGQFCGFIQRNPVCAKSCLPLLADRIRHCVTANTPEVFTCQLGLLCFGVPFSLPGFPRQCLVGGGVRERSIDLWQIEGIATAADFDPFLLLEQLESLPVVPRDEAQKTAVELHSIIPALQAENLHSLLLKRMVARIRSLTAVAAGADNAANPEEAVHALSEALAIVFDIPAVAVALPSEEGSAYTLSGTWNLPAVLGPFLLADARSLPDSSILSRDQLAELPMEMRLEPVTAIPLRTVGEDLGYLFLCGRALMQKEIDLLRLATTRTVGTLLRLRRQREGALREEREGRLLAAIKELASASGREELYSRLLRGAASLVDATAASFMILDNAEKVLNVIDAIGMNLDLARSMAVRVGEGIAGRVAANGTPLLVTDIEKDSRFGKSNRPRFRTKSFMSLPVEVNGVLFGVVNVSEKLREEVFSSHDLETLLAYVEHAATVLERVEFHERAASLEELSVTDPLTRLYNRRFLERRLQEELSRARRQGLHLTVMLIDLDHFKRYNDRCGHPEGDKALRKTSGILLASARQMDVVTRYGGEEFCIVLPATSKKESLFVAERIRRNIENELFENETELPLGKLTASLGIASFPEDGDTALELVEAADVALYASKDAGRNCVTCFSRDIHQKQKATAN